MHYDEQSGIIILMRGDSMSFPVRINEGTKLLPKYRNLRDNEVMYFGLMEPGAAFEDAVVKKRYTSESPTDTEGNILVTFKPTDTEYLLVGKYYYMVKLKSTVDDVENVTTIIPPTLFWIDGCNPIRDESDRQSVVIDIKDEIIFEGGEIT